MHRAPPGVRTRSASKSGRFVQVTSEAISAGGSHVWSFIRRTRRQSHAHSSSCEWTPGVEVSRRSVPDGNVALGGTYKRQLLPYRTSQTVYSIGDFEHRAVIFYMPWLSIHHTCVFPYLWHMHLEILERLRHEYLPVGVVLPASVQLLYTHRLHPRARWREPACCVHVVSGKIAVHVTHPPSHTASLRQSVFSRFLRRLCRPSVSGSFSPLFWPKLVDGSWMPLGGPPARHLPHHLHCRSLSRSTMVRPSSVTEPWVLLGPTDASSALHPSPLQSASDTYRRSPNSCSLAAALGELLSNASPSPGMTVQVSGCRGWL